MFNRQTIAFRHFILRLLGLVALSLLLLPAHAQTDYRVYQWQAVDIALQYPTTWDFPLPTVSDDGTHSQLVLAQDLIEIPSRPPELATVTFTVRPASTADDLYAVLATAMQARDIRPTVPLPARLIDQTATASIGTSADGTLFGIGRATRLDDARVLTVVGRVEMSQREAFLGTFAIIADSLQAGVDAIPTRPAYGALWHVQSTVADGPDALIDLRELVYVDGKLYTVDTVAGLARMDARSGRLEMLSALDPALQVNDLAQAGTTLYIADAVCGCVRVIDNGQERTTIPVDAPDSPQAVSVSRDGSVYYTRLTATDDVQVVRWNNGERTVLTFDEPVFQQPLLVIDNSNTVYALVDDALVYQLQGDRFVFAYVLDNGAFVNDATLNTRNQWVLATDGDGVLVFDTQGAFVDQVGQLVDVPQSAGEVVAPQGVAVDNTGAIYWVESDGRTGHVNAVSLRVPAGRVGDLVLNPTETVSGTLDDETPAQTWLFDAIAGETVTLTALATFDAFDLDLALRIIAPDGTEIARADDDEDGVLENVFDPQLAHLPVPTTGQYLVIVERVDGIGAYDLGLSRLQGFILETGTTRIAGILRDTVPHQRYLIQVDAPRTFTITLRAEDEFLDPLLMVYNRDGTLIAENDDADDPALGFDAQLSALSLAPGVYLIEATRFSGEGAYQLQINAR